MSQKSGRITVAAAGTAVAGPDVDGVFLLQAAPANTGDYCYVGDDGAGDVASDTGFALKKGLNWATYTGNLSDLMFDSDTNGDKVEWLLIGTYQGQTSPAA